MAHKKGGGSSTNGRDSNAQRLGVKAFAGELVTGGSIITRQRGTRIKPGVECGHRLRRHAFCQGHRPREVHRPRRPRTLCLDRAGSGITSPGRRSSTAPSNHPRRHQNQKATASTAAFSFFQSLIAILCLYVSDSRPFIFRASTFSTTRSTSERKKLLAGCCTATLVPVWPSAEAISFQR